MKKIRAAIVGYGNIGKYVLEALQAAEDFEIAGIIRRDAANVPEELKSYTVATEIGSLGKVDVAILWHTEPQRTELRAEIARKRDQHGGQFRHPYAGRRTARDARQGGRAARRRFDHVGRLGPGQRLGGARSARSLRPERDYLHELRPRHEHGSHRSRQGDRRG